jgi:hypothetical protein
MPDRVYKEDEFNSKAQELRKKLNSGSENTLFKNGVPQKEIPVSALPMFFKVAWARIKQNKEVSLPQYYQVLAAC